MPMIEEIKMGDLADFRNFMGAVIDEKSFANTNSYIELARTGTEAKILAGGTADKKEGWFIRPTLVQVTNPRHRLMSEEIFAPRRHPLRLPRRPVRGDARASATRPRPTR